MSVTPGMIAVALGQAAPETGSVMEQQWNMWIEDANLLIDARATQLGITLDPFEVAKRDYVVREAVVAHVKRPDDATQVTVSVDDASSSRSYQSGKGRVVIRDEWWPLLGLTDPVGAFSIDTIAFRSPHLPWCSFSLGARYCSCGVDIAWKPIYETGDDGSL
jgi:hypothetical protein